MLGRLSLRGRGLLFAGLILPFCVLGAGVGFALGGSNEPAARSNSEETALAATTAPPLSPVELAVNVPSFVATVEYQNQFTWPGVGPMTSYMGPGHPTGIDIGFSYDEDSTVRAAAAVERPPRPSGRGAPGRPG